MAKCVFQIGPEGEKNASQIWFEGDFGILNSGIFIYATWIWSKITSPSSTASVLNDGRISLEIPSFCPDFFFKIR